MSRIFAFFRKISNKVASILSIGLVTTLICVPLTNNFSITYEENFLKTNLVKANDLIMGPSSIQIDLKQSYTDDVLPTYLVLNASENVTLQASEGTSLPEGLSIKKTTTDQDGITSFVLVPDNSQLMPGKYTFSLQATDNGVTYAQTGNIALTVLPNYVESINITSINAIEVNKSDSYSTQLTATVSPTNANQNVKWFLQETANGVSISESGLLFIPGNIDSSEFEIVVGCVSEDKNYQNQPVSKTETISITIKEIYASSITISSPGDINFVYLDNSNWSYQFNYSLLPENATNDTNITYSWVNNQNISGMSLSNTGLLSVSDTNLLTVGAHTGIIRVNYLNKETNTLISDQTTISVNVAYAHADSITITNIKHNQVVDGGIIAFNELSNWSFQPQAVVNPSNANQEITWELAADYYHKDDINYFTIDNNTGEIKFSTNYINEYNFSTLIYNRMYLHIFAFSKENSTIRTDLVFSFEFRLKDAESFQIECNSSSTNISVDFSKVMNGNGGITSFFASDIIPSGAQVYDIVYTISGLDASYFKINNNSLLVDYIPNNEWIYSKEFHITIGATARVNFASDSARISSSNSLDLTITFLRGTPEQIVPFSDPEFNDVFDENETLNVVKSDYNKPITTIYPILLPFTVIQDSINVSIINENEYFTIDKIKYSIADDHPMHETLGDNYFYRFELYFSQNISLGKHHISLLISSSQYSEVPSITLNLTINIEEPLVESIEIINIEDNYTLHLSDSWELPLDAVVNPAGANQGVFWDLINSSDNFIISNKKLKYLENVDSQFQEQITIKATSVVNQNISTEKNITINFVYDEIESLSINGEDNFNVVFPYNDIITDFTITTFPKKADPNVIWTISGQDSSNFSISNDGYLRFNNSLDVKPGKYTVNVKATSTVNNQVFDEKQIVVNYYSNPTSVNITGIENNQNFQLIEGNTNSFASAIAIINPSTANQKVNWSFSIENVPNPNTVVITNETDNEINFSLSNDVKAGQTFSCSLTAETDIDSIGNTKKASISFTITIKSPLVPNSLSIKNVNSEYEIYNDNDEIIIQPSVVAEPSNASNSVVWTLKQSSNDFAINPKTGAITLINHKLLNATKIIEIEATSLYDTNIKDTVTTTIKVVNNIIVPTSIEITNIEDGQEFDSYLGDDSIIIKAIASINPLTANKNIQWTLSGKDNDEFLLDSQTGELKLSPFATLGTKEITISVESTLDPQINDYVKIIVNVLELPPVNNSDLILILSICIPLLIVVIIMIIILSIYFSKKNKNKNKE